MALNNSLVKKAQKPKFSVAIQSDTYKNLINNTLGNPKKAERFVAAISSAVATNPALQECDAGSILSAALLGESLNLSPSPQLGQYYMVPYNNKKKGVKEAQFQMGYRGWIQLALRSGEYKKINVIELKEGELKHFDILNEEIEAVIIEDFEARDKAETAGYYIMFETLNGFKKAMFWTKKQMLTYADKYSPAFKLNTYNLIQEGKIPQSEMWKYSSFWYSDFDLMAKKTMIRQLIPKWGPMSIEMQKAFEADIETEQKESAEFVENETVDNFFDDEPPEEVKQDEVIQPKNNKSTKKDKDKAVDIQEVLDEEIDEIFGQAEFFED